MMMLSFDGRVLHLLMFCLLIVVYALTNLPGIDEIYVINRDESIYRWEYIHRLFHKLDIHVHRYSAIEGLWLVKSMELHELYPRKKFHPLTRMDPDLTNKVITDGMHKEWLHGQHSIVACWQSQLYFHLLDHFNHTGVEQTIMILEDDVDFDIFRIAEQLTNVFEHIPQDWDVYFPGSCSNTITKNITSTLFQIN